MGHKLWAIFVTLTVAAIVWIPIARGGWGVYHQPEFDEGRSIAASDDAVYVGGLSLGSFDGYRLLKYNASGGVAWEKQFSVPERRITRERYRHVAVAAASGSVTIAFTNGTFDVKAYHANGTRLWQNRWRRQCSVTDMAIDGNHTIVAGCADSVAKSRYHLVAFAGNGEVAWNTSGRGRIYSVDVHGDTVLAGGEQDGTGILISCNRTGTVTDSRSFAPGAIRDVTATSDGVTLLHSTGDNVSLLTAPSAAGNTTRHYYGKTAAGNDMLAAYGRVFIAGSVYNHSARYRDFLVAEYLPNGTFTDVIRHNGNGSGNDAAWGVAAFDGVVATGAIYTQHIIPPNQVYINREIYTIPYQPDNLPPRAGFLWNPENPRANDHVSFTENATDPDGSIVQWGWSFGDGITATHQNPSHVYTDKGVYTVTLTVRDDDGATATATKEIVVAEEETTPGFSAALVCLAATLALVLRRRLTFK